jgi:phosphotransferase system enzyme I (PtsI)
MTRVEGKPLSPGFACGIAVVYDCEVERTLAIPHRDILRSDVQTECDRIDVALEQSTCDLKLADRNVNGRVKIVDAAALLSVHAAMAREISASVKQQIGSDLVNVEQALDTVLRDWITRLQKLDDDYLRQREQDVRDVGQRITRNLAGAIPWSPESLPPGSVIVARELLPSEAVALVGSGVVAIVTEYGSKLSHTAIIANSLGIPAVSGLSEVTTHIPAGARLLVNGVSGSVTIDPSKQEEESFSSARRDDERNAATLRCEERQHCVTTDGVEVSIFGNVGLPQEVRRVGEHHLSGVGLCRTEFLFLESNQRPSFEMQLEVYGNMAAALAESPMVIRTFDLGGDKLPPFLALDKSINHALLQLRGLRFSLSEIDLLDAQLRAIVQVAQTADVRILFPMVIGSHDFAQAIAAVDRAMNHVDAVRRPPVGAMIETPAALFALDEIMELADFVAIGTNDLTQYMLAADRDLSEGTDDCTAMHPAVLRAIKQIVEVADKWNRPACACGEEAGDVNFACLLLGLGIRELSLSPASAVAVRRAIREIDSQLAAEIATQALRCRSPSEVREQLLLLSPSLPNARNPPLYGGSGRRIGR